MDSSIGSILKLAPPLIWVGSLALLAPPNQCPMGAEAPWLDCWQSIEDGPETMLLSIKVILRLFASQRGPVVHLRSAPSIPTMRLGLGLAYNLGSSGLIVDLSS